MTLGYNACLPVQTDALLEVEDKVTSGWCYQAIKSLQLVKL